MATCEECGGRGGRWDDECQDQWYWSGRCNAADDYALSRRLTLRGLAEGLRGVIWGMAAECSRVEWGIVWAWTKDMQTLRREFTAWLLDQARPAGCRAPWEVE